MNTLIDGERSDHILKAKVPSEAAGTDLLRLLLQLKPEIICEGVNSSLWDQLPASLPPTEAS